MELSVAMLQPDLFVLHFVSDDLSNTDRAVQYASQDGSPLFGTGLNTGTFVQMRIKRFGDKTVL